MDSLGPQDFDTPTWRRLVAHLARDREKLIADLIRPQTDETATHRLRGRIKQIDELLALPVKTAPAQPTAPATRPYLSDE